MDRESKILVGLVLAAATLGLFVVWSGWGRDARPPVVAPGVEGEIMQTVTTTWTSGGAQQTVTTPRQEDESTEDWVARHRDAVVAMQAAFPPDPR